MEFLYELPESFVELEKKQISENIQWYQYAVVVELVDTQVSGTCFRKGVGVRVSPTAHPIPWQNNQLQL